MKEFNDKTMGKEEINLNGVFTKNKDASFVLPVFKVEDDKLNVIKDKEVIVPLVTNSKEQQAMVILELIILDNVLKWKYEDKDGEASYYVIDDPKLKKVEAILMGTDPIVYQLEIYDGEKNLGITVNEEGLLTEDNKVIDLANLPDNAYIASMDINQKLPAKEGTTITCLINMLIYELQCKNKENNSKPLVMAITKLQETQMWLSTKNIN